MKLTLTQPIEPAGAMFRCPACGRTMPLSQAVEHGLHRCPKRHCPKRP